MSKEYPDCFTPENDMRNAACEVNSRLADASLKLQQIKNLCNPGSHKTECECVTCLIIKIVDRN